MKMCDKCVRAILSGGEKLSIGMTISGEGADLVCEQCEESGFDALVEAWFEQQLYIIT